MIVKSWLRNLAAEFRHDLFSGRFISALTAGSASGLGLVATQIAFGSFIYSGTLAPFSSFGVGLVLFGNFAACLVVALVGGYRGVIAGMSPALVIVMATIVSSVNAKDDALFFTAAVVLMISAIATGVGCLLIGWFRLSNLFRFIPYPVTAGFVAGIGGAVFLASLAQMGIDPNWQSLPTFLEPTKLLHWGPGIGFGIVLYLAMKRWRHPLVMPLIVGLAMAGFHLTLNVLGLSGEQARAAGWLFESTAAGGLWPALSPSDLVQVEWGSIGPLIPDMLLLIFVAFVTVILNFAGLELATNQELDWDREFRVTGVASLITGMGGGTVATIVVPASLRSKMVGAATRLTGVVAALVIGSVLFLGDGMLQQIPIPLLGGMLVFASLGMLEEGFLSSYRRLPWSEFGVVVLIFFCIVSFGLFEGVGAGLLATLVFLTVRFSRVDLIESHFTAQEHRSHKVRPIPDQVILQEEGRRVQAYLLSGYVFFGSVCPLAERLRKHLSEPSPPACLVLDFSSVSGFDFSAVSVLGRFLLNARANGVCVVLSALSTKLKAGFQRNLPQKIFTELLVQPDADQALEYCEDIVIAAWKENEQRVGERRASLLESSAADLERHLERQMIFEDLVEKLQGRLNSCLYEVGETLSGPNGDVTGLQLLLSGRASATNPEGGRLLQYSPGDVIWSFSSLNSKTVSVVADEACKTLVLSVADQHWLEENNEKLALRLYGYMLSIER